MIVTPASIFWGLRYGLTMMGDEKAFFQLAVGIQEENFGVVFGGCRPDGQSLMGGEDGLNVGAGGQGEGGFWDDGGLGVGGKVWDGVGFLGDAQHEHGETDEYEYPSQDDSGFE